MHYCWNSFKKNQRSRLQHRKLHTYSIIMRTYHVKLMILSTHVLNASTHQVHMYCAIMYTCTVHVKIASAFISLKRTNCSQLLYNIGFSNNYEMKRNQVCWTHYKTLLIHRRHLFIYVTFPLISHKGITASWTSHTHIWRNSGKPKPFVVLNFPKLMQIILQ